MWCCHWAQEWRGEHAPPERSAAEKRGHRCCSVPFLNFINHWSRPSSLTEAVGKGKETFFQVFVKGQNSYSVCYIVGPSWQCRDRDKWLSLPSFSQGRFQRLDHFLNGATYLRMKGKGIYVKFTSFKTWCIICRNVKKKKERKKERNN